MNKWIILAGAIITSFLIYQVQLGKITTEDVVGLVVSREFSEMREDMEEWEEGVVVEEEEVEEVVDESPLSIMAFGDMMLGRYVRVLMDENGKDYLFENVAHLFEGSDVVFGNLEGPINGEGHKGGTSMVFSFNKDIAEFLKGYGFNLLTIANNHSLDQGWDGRVNTVEAFDEIGLGWCGHPTEAEAGSVYYGEEHDMTYAFVCFNDVMYALNDNEAVTLIETVSEEVDYTIVTIHWGYEYNHKPDQRTQVLPGRSFVKAGADIVIGHHPHVVQSFEIYDGVPIFYSLGNFIFDQYWSTETQEELAIRIEFDEEKTGIELVPMKSVMSQPYVLEDDEKNRWIEEFITYGDYDEEMKTMIRSGNLELF